MKKRHHDKSNRLSNRLKLILISFFVVILSIPLVVKCITYKHKNSYASKKIALPKLDETVQEAEEAVENDPWVTIRTRPGDTMAAIFKRSGLSAQTLHTLLNKNQYAKALTRIKANQQIRLLIRNKVLEKLAMPLNSTQDLVITLENKQYTSKIKSRKMTSQNNFITATVQGSLFTTARRLNISNKLIKQMTEIFHWEIDFVKEVHSSDQFSIAYEAYYIDNKLVNVGDILAVTYTAQGQIHRAVRHTSASGSYEYYNPEGVSLKKAFTRYPVNFSHISSTFSLSRYHPILHYKRPHYGVDLAAAIGTPVHATGDGLISIIDRQGAYGNMIKITHDSKYASVYAHLLKFQKGLYRGARVKRGQVIGYVGQSGLADGPHCHYEFHVNHNPKNPSTVELPRGSPIAKRDMLSFKHQANDILAQLKLYQDASLAAAGKKIRKMG